MKALPIAVTMFGGSKTSLYKVDIPYDRYKWKYNHSNIMGICFWPIFWGVSVLLHSASRAAPPITPFITADGAHLV